MRLPACRLSAVGSNPQYSATGPDASKLASSPRSVELWMRPRAARSSRIAARGGGELTSGQDYRPTMASTTQFPPHTTNGHDEPTRRRWTRGRVAIAAWLLIVAGFWFYAFVLAPKGSPDILDEPAFATASEARCKQARTVIDALPNANTAKSAVERADVIDLANRELADMLATISLLPTGTPHD